jgi:hypothetical protein
MYIGTPFPDASAMLELKNRVPSLSRDKASLVSLKIIGGRGSQLAPLSRLNSKIAVAFGQINEVNRFPSGRVTRPG